MWDLPNFELTLIAVSAMSNANKWLQKGKWDFMINWDQIQVA